MSYPTLRGPDDPGEPQPSDPTPVPTDQEGQFLPPPPRGGGVPGWVRVAAILAAVAVAGAAALAYRSYHRQRVLREGVARARTLMRADTFAGYRDAAQLLEPLARLDPVEAGALRALALAMLFADYREARAADQAEALLVEPGRAVQVPDEAQLAYAALALGRQEAGTAASFALRARGPMGLALQARTSLLAGNLGAAAEPLARAVEEDPTFPAALGLRGDVQRRSGMPADARKAYQDALAASPLHPRSAYGLAKLALGGQADPAQAREALSRILDDRQGTPANERARAALLLAALLGRTGDRAGATAALDRAGLDPGARGWMERAVAELELARGGYHVVGGAPAGLLSASDDDPYVPPPPPPPRTEPARPQPKKAAIVAKKPVPKKAAVKKGKAARASKAAKKKVAAKKVAKKKAKPAAKKKPAKKVEPRRSAG
jgi:hypothetical protein